MSLLKPYTNFDSIKALNKEELAQKLAIVEANAVCCYISMGKEEYEALISQRKNQWLEYLESEAER